MMDKGDIEKLDYIMTLIKYDNILGVDYVLSEIKKFFKTTKPIGFITVGKRGEGMSNHSLKLNEKEYDEYIKKRKGCIDEI